MTPTTPAPSPALRSARRARVGLTPGRAGRVGVTVLVPALAAATAGIIPRARTDPGGYARGNLSLAE